MKQILLIIVGLLIASSNTFSQLDCYEDCEGTPWIKVAAPYTAVLVAPECSVSVSYEWRLCNGVYEYRYTNIEAFGNCVQMENFSIYHYNINSLYEMIDMIIAEEAFFMDGVPAIPSCNQTITKTKFYSAACGVWVKCSYIIDQTAEVKKDRGFVGACALPNEDGYIHKWKWQPCGETCCRRDYDVCWYNSPVNGTMEVRVTQHPAMQVGICTQQDDYGPWEITDPMDPNYHYECQHGCGN